MTEIDVAGHDDFLREAETLRGELLAHCYRLSGSLQDAEDLVQETMLRAWRAHARFRGDATLRTWLYRIATNAFLSARRPRRTLPSGLGPPQADVSLDVVLSPETPWIGPLPDALVADEQDPAALALARERLRLALVAGLQRLPARQRAALLLREALDFSAAEIADTLDITVPAVKSLLQRARATLGALDREPAADDALSPAAERLLETYMRAFETSDVRLLERVVTADASLEMTPSPTWYEGRATCLPYLARVVGQPGEWSMRATRANGQPAAVAWRWGEPFGVAVLTLRDGHLARISVFAEPALVGRFAARS